MKLDRIIRRSELILWALLLVRGTMGANGDGTPALRNGDFEQGAQGWHLLDKGMSAIVPEAAHSGGAGLRVIDNSTKSGSNCRSDPVPAQAGKAYAVEFWGRPVENEGAVALYLQFFDEQGRNLTVSSLHGENILPITGESGAWHAFTLAAIAPEGTTTLRVWIHSFNGSTGCADIDDLSLRELTTEETAEHRRDLLLRSRHGFPAPAPERVDAIAAWLTPKPLGVARAIADRAAWEPLAALPDAAKIIREALKLRDTPMPDLPDELYLEFTRSGNRTKYQTPYGRRVRQLNTLLLAECLEARGRFLPALERDILALCDERSWVMPAHDSQLVNFNRQRLTIDLGSSARGWLLADIDTQVGERLGAEVRERLRSEVRRRIIDPYLAAVRSENVSGNWWMRGNNNWNAVCTAGAVWCALALVEDPRERALALAAMELSNPHFIGGFTDDGYCSEGMGYWNYGFGHYIMMGLAVRAATRGKLDIFQDEKLLRIAQYARGYQIQSGRAPWFADGGGSPSHDIWALMLQVWPEAVPAGFKPPSLLKVDHALIALRAFGQEPAQATGQGAGGQLPLHTYFDAAQVLITRAAPGVDPPFGAAIKGGHNAEHHNHNDVGSYTIVLGGVEMLGDPGGEIYTRRTFSRERYTSQMLNSYGHPVPQVAGQLQPAGRVYAAEVLATEFSESRDRIVLDLTKAYPVPELEGLRRAFTHDREARVITIVDDVRFKTPQTFSSPLITYRKATRLDAGTLVLEGDKGAVEVRIEAEGGAWELEEELLENPGKPSPRRMAVAFAAPVASARVRLTITPVGATSP